MKKALIIHGAYGNPKENWIPWLKVKLEENRFEVIVPSFPTPEDQNLDNWLSILSLDEFGFTGYSTLIGHSIGAVFLLTVLEKIKKPVPNVILVSGFLHDLGNETFDKINATFYKKDFDWKTIKNNAKNISVVHGENDPYVPISEAQYLAKKLGVKVKVIKNGKHLNKVAGFIEFPELLQMVLKS